MPNARRWPMVGNRRGERTNFASGCCAREPKDHLWRHDVQSCSHSDNTPGAVRAASPQQRVLRAPHGVAGGVGREREPRVGASLLRAQEVLESIRDAEELASAPVAAATSADRARMLATNSDGAKVDEDTPLGGARARAAVAAARDAVAECGLADALREKIARWRARQGRRGGDSRRASRPACSSAGGRRCATTARRCRARAACRRSCRSATSPRAASRRASGGACSPRSTTPSTPTSARTSPRSCASWRARSRGRGGVLHPLRRRHLARAERGVRVPHVALAAISAAEAIRVVARGARPCARPNAGFRQQLKAWERALRHRRRARDARSRREPPARCAGRRTVRR